MYKHLRQEASVCKGMCVERVLCAEVSVCQKRLSVQKCLCVKASVRTSVLMYINVSVCKRRPCAKASLYKSACVKTAVCETVCV